MDRTVESKVVESAACPGCGVEVRDGSEYCYNCGYSIAKTVLDDPDSDSVRPGENGFQANGPGAIKKDANTRRRARRPLTSRTNEPVQVVWERREDSGVGFLIVSLVAGGIALLLIFIAYYLK